MDERIEKLFFENTRINVEITNHCNIKCYYCANRLLEKRYIMSLEQFKRLIDDLIKVNGFSKNIILCGNGEPFLNKEIYNFIEYATGKGITVNIQSNGKWQLNEKELTKLLKAETLSITIDGVTNQTYNNTRPDTDVEKIISNLAKVVKLRNESGSKKPIITGKMNIFSFNIHEAKDFVNKCIEIGADEVFFAKGEGPEQFMNCVLNKEDFEVFENKIPIKIESTLINKNESCNVVDQKLSNTDFLKLKKDPLSLFEKLLCPKSALTIHSNGSMLSCPFDIFHRNPIGNIFSENIEDLFKKSRINRLCRKIITGMYNGNYGLSCYHCAKMLSITNQGKRLTLLYRIKYKILYILKIK